MRYLPLLAIGSVVACSKGSGVPQATRTDSAGVEIVLNPGVDHPLTWPVLATDTLVDPASDTIFQGEARALALAVDSRGRLIAVDGGFGDRRVLRQGADGAWHQVGRKGGGPGEYQFPGTVSVAPTGELLVGDFGQRAFIHFGADDRPLPNIPWSLFGEGFSRGGGFAGVGVISVQWAMSDSSSSQTLRLLTPTDSLLLARVVDPSPSMAMFESCHVGFPGRKVFAADLQWTSNAVEVAVAQDATYRIDIWRGGKQVRSIRRPLPPRAATKALAEQDLGEGERIVVGKPPACLIPASEIVEKRGFASTIPAVKRLSVAADGTLWVERYTIRGEPMQRDVFDPTGTYLGTLTGDLPWPQAWMPDGQYVAVSANADSLPVVVRYAVGGAVRKE